MIKTALSLAAILVLAGCANMDSALQRETARAIDGNVRPDDVKLSNVDRSFMSVKWNVEVDQQGLYECNADDMLKRVNCVKLDVGVLLKRILEK